MNNEFIIGFFIGIFFYLPFEVLLLNLIYFKNLDLFFDIMVTKKNKNKIKKYFTDDFNCYSGSRSSGKSLFDKYYRK